MENLLSSQSVFYKMIVNVFDKCKTDLIVEIVLTSETLFIK